MRSVKINKAQIRRPVAIEPLEGRVLLSSFQFMERAETGARIFDAKTVRLDGDVALYEFQSALWLSDATADGTRKIFSGTITDLQTFDSGRRAVFLTEHSLVYTVDVATGEATHLAVNFGEATEVHVPSPTSTSFYVGNEGVQFQLWKSDGTVSGTSILKTFTPTKFGKVWGFAKGPDGTYMMVKGFGVNGSVVRTDGTIAGTVELPSLIPNVDTEAQIHFAGSNLVYTSLQGIWRLDTASAATEQIFDTGFSGLVFFDRLFDNKVLFSYGARYWQTDGTVLGTKQIVTSSIHNVRAVELNDRLLITDGHEMWRLDEGSDTTVPILNSVGEDSWTWRGSVRLFEHQGRAYFTVGGGLLSTDGTDADTRWELSWEQQLGTPYNFTAYNQAFSTGDKIVVIRDLVTSPIYDLYAFDPSNSGNLPPTPTVSDLDFGGRETAHLDASGTTDPESDPLFFMWDTNGDNGFDQFGPTVDIIAPIAQPLTKTVRLFVSDGIRIVEKKLVLNWINNMPDVSAGGPYTVFGTQPVTFTAAGTDPDGDALTFTWDLDGDGEYDDATGQTATIPNVQGRDSFSVFVRGSDGLDIAHSGALVTPINRPPTIVPGGPYSVFRQATASFDVSQSTDPDGDVLTFTWDIDGDGEFDDATGATPSIPGTDLPAFPASQAEGVVQVKVRATDGLAVVEETIDITVSQREPRLLARIAGASIMVDGLTYFATWSESTGMVLWRSDGTDEGTSAVAVLPGGNDMSSVGSFTVAGPFIYFKYQKGSPDFVSELWRTDRTAAGTVRIGEQFTNISSAFVAGGEFYFTGRQSSPGRPLYRVVGNSVSVKKVVSNWSQTEGEPVVIGNKVYAYLHQSREDAAALVVLDVKSRRVKRLTGSMGQGSHFGMFGPPWARTEAGVAYRGEFYFHRLNGLWKTDGDGTSQVIAGDSDRSTVRDDFNFTNLTVHNDRLYFTAMVDGAYGLFESDGTESGTQRLMNLPVKTTANIPPVNIEVSVNLKFIGDTLYIGMRRESGSWQLWRSDLTEAGTTMLHDFGSSPVREMIDLNGKLLFSLFDGTIWTSEGTVGGTQKLTSLTVGTSNPARFIESAGNLVKFWSFPEIYMLDVPSGNAAPTAVPGGPYDLPAGVTSVTFDATASSDPDGDAINYLWDLDNDGSFDDAIGPRPVISLRDLRSRGLGAEQDTYTINLRAIDVRGNRSTTASTTIHIDPSHDSTAPLVTFDSLMPVHAGDRAIAFRLRFADSFGIDGETLRKGLLQVRRPDGSTDDVIFNGVAVESTAESVIGIYTIDPQTGTLGFSDNGEYTVQLKAGGAMDGLGNISGAADVGTFTISVETNPPVVTLSMLPITRTDRVEFAATFRDDVGLDLTKQTLFLRSDEMFFSELGRSTFGGADPTLPDERAELKFAWFRSQGLPFGGDETYTAKLVGVDLAGNEADAEVVFKLETAPVQPLLVAELSGDRNRSHDQNIVAPRKSRTVYSRIRNDGSLAIDQDVTIRYVLSRDLRADDTDILIKDQTTHLKLAPGSRRSIQTTLRLPDDVPASNYFIIAQVDPGNSVFETNKVNNHFHLGEYRPVEPTDVSIVPVLNQKPSSLTKRQKFGFNTGTGAMTLNMAYFGLTGVGTIDRIYSTTATVRSTGTLVIRSINASLPPAAVSSGAQLWVSIQPTLSGSDLVLWNNQLLLDIS